MVSERIELLARHNRRHFTPKYVPPPPKKYKPHDRPVTPIKNERLEMLCRRACYKTTPKFAPAKVPSSYVDKAALEAVLTARLDHLSRPFVAKLKATKQGYAYLGKQFQQTMNEKIAMSLDTIYYHNAKSRMAIEAEKKAAKKKPKKKTIWDESTSRVAILAIPKQVHEPPPPPKRKCISLKKIKSKINNLSRPTRRMKYKRPSQDSLVIENKRRLEAALRHVTRPIEKKLSIPPERFKKEKEPFMGVKRAALTYEITERVNELASPRPRANAPEMDFKENAYEISPNALKYKPTPRIIKLAKPVER